MRGLLTAEMDPRPLALARMLVGLVAMGFTFEWLGTLARVSTGKLAIPVFGGMPPPTENIVLIVFAVSLAASAAMVLGLAGRAPAILVATTTAVVLFVDQQTYSNHLVLLMMLALLISFSGAAQAWTVSRVPHAQKVPSWPAFLIKVQVTTLYAWTAAAKINPQYLSGEVLDTFLQPWVPVPGNLLPAVALLSILTEAFLAVALWIPRTRKSAFVVGAGLHVGIVVMLVPPAPLAGFGALMLCGYILFAWNPQPKDGRALAAAARPSGS